MIFICILFIFTWEELQSGIERDTKTREAWKIKTLIMHNP